MANIVYPDWVLKFKQKGTELRFINNKYYLYKVHCEIEDGLSFFMYEFLYSIFLN